jgi:hypothetical protein
MSTGHLKYVKEPTSTPISGYTRWAVNIFNWYNDKLLEPPYNKNSYLTKITRDKLKNGDTVIVEIDNKILFGKVNNYNMGYFELLPYISQDDLKKNLEYVVKKSYLTQEIKNYTNYANEKIYIIH